MCRDCGRVQFYDYVPKSLSNPITTSACGHGLTLPMYGPHGWAEGVTVDQAIQAFVNGDGYMRPKKPTRNFKTLSPLSKRKVKVKT